MANLRALLALADEAEQEDGTGLTTKSHIAEVELPVMQRKRQTKIDEGVREMNQRQPLGAAEQRQPLVVWDEYSSSRITPTRSGKPAANAEGDDGDEPGKKGAPMDHASAVKTINRYMEILSKSESGKALIDMAEEMGIRFAIDTQAGVYGYYSPNENLVAINPKVDEGRAIATLAHELRHAWQFKNGYHTKLDFRPRDNVWMMRAMEADAEANSLKVCAELMEAGYPQAMQSHLQSEYGDEAMAFLSQVQEDPASLKNGKAQRAAFDQWFSKNWRRAAYDKHSIDYLEHFSFAIDSKRKKNGFAEMTAKWLHGMGKQPDGSNYLDHKKDDMDLDDDFYREGIARDVEDRLAHIERRLDGTKRGKDKDDPLRFPSGRARNGRTGGAANDDSDLPIAAMQDYDGKKPPVLVRKQDTSARRMGM